VTHDRWRVCSGRNEKRYDLRRSEGSESKEPYELRNGVWDNGLLVQFVVYRSSKSREAHRREKRGGGGEEGTGKPMIIATRPSSK